MTDLKGTVKMNKNIQRYVVDWSARKFLITDDQIIEEASPQLETIFGFGVTEKRDSGMFFYDQSWVLGDGMGFVCFGGRRASMLITLTDRGYQNAVVGWEKRLFDIFSPVRTVTQLMEKAA